MRINLLLSALILILLPSFASIAIACTCAQVTPCESYAAASVVFVGRVSKTSETPSLAARFMIEEAFLGVKGAEIELTGGGTTCDYDFKAGERYLVYAYQNRGVVQTSICSGTALLSESKEGLDYLRKAKQSPGSTVSGDITREIHRGSAEWKFEPIVNAEIILEDGKRRFRASSNAEGKFTLSGITEGRYRVHTNPLTNFSGMTPLNEGPQKEWLLDVPRQGCVSAWFVARPSGEISGTIVDESGVAAGNVQPELIPADEPLTEYNYRSVVLRDVNKFIFSFVPAGRYYLGFNLRDGGVKDRSKATVITIAEGQKIQGLRIKRPSERQRRR